MSDRQLGFVSPPSGTWVQTDRAAHEKWARLTLETPRAAGVLHVLVGSMGRHNAIVVSQKTLAKMCACSVRTLQYALDVLKERHWVEVRRLGPTGTVNAYVVNDRVAWSGKREGIRYSLFSASVLLSSEEQPDQALLESLPVLEPVPALFADEKQLPTGDGMDPPSEPAIPGMEPNLPSTLRGD